MKKLLAFLVTCATAVPSALAQGSYDFLKRDNPYGMAEQPQRGLPRLGESVAAPHLGVTVFQSRAPDGHGLVLIDNVDTGGPLGRLANQITPGGVAINAIDTYHPATIAQLMQIMDPYSAGTTVKLELLQFLPKVGFTEFPIRLQ
jgi:hypothetical protein